MILLICCILLVLSVFFSSYETAFYSIEKKRKKKTQNILITLNVILMGNASVRVLFSEISSYNLEHYLAQYPIPSIIIPIISILTVSLILITFGESIPLNFGIANSEFIYKKLTWFIKLASFLFWPIVKPLTWIVSHMVDSLSAKYQKPSNLTEEEVRSIIQLSYEKEIVNPHEKHLTDAVINLYTQSVNFSMLPRRDVIFTDLEETLSEAWDKMKKNSITEIVVQEESIDNIVGYIAIEDIALIPQVSTSQVKLSSLKDKIRQHVTIPESKKIIDALDILREQRRNLGVVIDEYGGVDGIVTMRRLLGSLLVFESENRTSQGDNTEETNWIMPQEDGIVVYSLRVTLRMVLEYFNQNIQGIAEEDWTISRLILKKIDRFPKEGEELQIQNLYFQIISMQNHVINKVYISLVGNPMEDVSDASY